MIYGVPVRQLQRQLTSAEFSELIAADMCGLIPDPWLQTGVLASVIANVNRPREADLLSPNDFMPHLEEKTTRKQDWSRVYWQRKAMYGR